MLPRALHRLELALLDAFVQLNCLVTVAFPFGVVLKQSVFLRLHVGWSIQLGSFR